MSQGYLNRTGINFFENFVTKITVYRSLTPPRKFVSQVSTGSLAVVYQAEVKDLRGDTCKWRGDEKIYTTLRLRFDPLAANCIQMTIVNLRDPSRDYETIRRDTSTIALREITCYHILRMKSVGNKLLRSRFRVIMRVVTRERVSWFCSHVSYG